MREFCTLLNSITAHRAGDAICTIFDAAGMGEGSHPLPETATARTGEVRAVALLLLIMSKAQMGLIACKVSGGAGRYERALDFGNEVKDKGTKKAGMPLRVMRIAGDRR